MAGRHESPGVPRRVFTRQQRVRRIPGTKGLVPCEHGPIAATVRFATVSMRLKWSANRRSRSRRAMPGARSQRAVRADHYRSSPAAETWRSDNPSCLALGTSDAPLRESLPVGCPIVLGTIPSCVAGSGCASWRLRRGLRNFGADPFSRISAISAGYAVDVLLKRARGGRPPRRLLPWR